jgi:ribulose-5-phosphate 4-epimerase/fuculose-1-phosphate aldolase
MSEAEARESLVAFGRSMFERRLTFGSSGNISVKTDGGWLMTPTNVSLGALDPARLSMLDENGKLVSGDAPTKESFLHLAMYRERGGAGAVVHLHSTHSVAVSCLDAAVNAIEELEETARLYLMLRGAPTRFLTPQQVKDLLS